jgi:hypothetical protein
LDRRCHFKHVSFKQSRFYHCQTSMAQGKGSRSTECCHNKHKISLSAYTWCIFNFRARLVCTTDWILFPYVVIIKSTDLSLLYRCILFSMR